MNRFNLLIAALLLPIFFACTEKPEPDPTPTPNPPSPIIPPEPEPIPIEFRRTITFDNNIVSTNSSNDYVAIYEKELMQTKSGDTREISTGSYTFDQKTKTFDLKGFGNLEVISDEEISFTPATGGSAKTYKAKTTLIESDESSNASLINRSWAITKTILKFRGVNYTFDGLDLNEVEKIAREQGIEFKYRLDDGMVVDKIIMTDSIIGAYFKNKQSYAATHTLRKGSEFNLSEFTYGLDGTATVQFVDELCVVTIKTTLDESPAEIVLTLKEYGK